MSLQSRLSDVIGSIGTDVKSVNSNISTVSNNLSSVSSRLNLVSNNVSSVSSRLTLVSNSISSVSSRLNTVSSNLSGVSSTLNAVSSSLAGSGGSSDYAQTSTYRKLFEFEDLDGWTLATSNGGTITNLDVTQGYINHIGNMQLDTNSSTNGKAYAEHLGTKIRPSNTTFEALIASNGTNAGADPYIFKLGLINPTGLAGTENSGFGFELNNSISNNIIAFCYTNAGVLNRVTTDVVFDGSVSHRLVKAVMNSGGTQCDFYINVGSGYSLVASITGSIYPDTCVPSIKLAKTSGTNNRRMYVDKFYIEKPINIFNSN